MNGTLDTNQINDTSEDFDISKFEKISVYLFHNDGPHSNQVVTLQVSPDGNNWVDAGIIEIKSHLAFNGAGYRARLKVTTAQGASSQSNYHFVGY